MEPVEEKLTLRTCESEGVDFILLDEEQREREKSSTIIRHLTCDYAV